MKTLFNLWFISFCLIWLSVYLLRLTGHAPPAIINNYLTDLLAVPVIANLGLWFQRVFIIKSNYYVLSIWHVVFVFAYVSILFEVILPRFSKAYTGDWMDVVMYAIGGAFFCGVMNKVAGGIKLKQQA